MDGLACAVIPLVALLGCERSPTHQGGTTHDKAVTAESASDPGDRTSPSDTIRRVHEHRLAGRVTRIGPHLLPEQRLAVLDLIRAVDRLAGGNDVLRSAAEKQFGAASAMAFDRPAIGDIIGVFSRDVEVIDERIDGDSATVTIQVGGRVPLQEVRLIHRDRRWLIESDPPITGVADQLRKLADIMLDTARRVREGKLTAAALQEELDARAAPIGRRLAELTR